MATGPAPRTAQDVVLRELAPAAGRSVLDIGCGAGRLRSPLEAAGMLWRGIDPAPPPDSRSTDTAWAEAMPYPDRSFDAAICVNALHHVPVPDMDAALQETARVLRPGGRLVVIEPRADGNLSRVIAVVDDETGIRHAAQSAMDRTTALIECHAYDYDRTERYADFAAFRDSLIAVDPGRAATIAARQQSLKRVFETHAVRNGLDLTLSQPMSVRVFTAP